MKNYEAVIFDMDGVLIDAREWHYEALNEALGIFGESISYEEHLGRFDGLPTKVKLRMLREDGRIAEPLIQIIEAVKQERTLRAAARLCFPRIEHLIMLSELRRRGFKTW
jgi:beta-phosphoglucomutase-like phosphatase (HAD superfamily)